MLLLLLLLLKVLLDLVLQLPPQLGRQIRNLRLVLVVRCLELRDALVLLLDPLVLCLDLL